MKDKDPVDLAEIQRDLDEYFKDKLAVLEVFKSMHKDSIEDTVEKVVRLIDKARRHG